MVALGGGPVNREGVLTDNGSVILDVHNLKIQSATALEERLNAIVGVVIKGLFACRPAYVLFMGASEGVKTVKAK